MTYPSKVHGEDIHDRILIPPRSRLFGLDPIGSGSYKSEGLISYLIRLAKMHCISPRLLINAQLLPLMRGVNSVRHAEFYSDYAKTLQSTGKFAEKFVAIVEELTCRTEIARLTTLPWHEVVPAIGTGLMTQHPQWCNACLADDRARNKPAYFRLSWGYALYRVCTRHHLQLVNVCPWCGKHQPFIPVHAHMGRCNYCYGWLGTVAAIEPISNNAELLWVSSAIEDMIIHCEHAKQQVTGESFRSKLMLLVNTLANGHKTKLSEMLGMTRSTMASWITKKQKPLFPQFLYFCQQLGMMPSTFLLSDFDVHKIEMTHQQNIKKLHLILPRIGLQEPPKADIYLRLKVISSDPSDCRPLTAIATELALTKKYLSYWFEKECGVISLKHKQSISKMSALKRKEQILSVRNITWYLYSKGQYPSNRTVAKLIAPLKLSFRKPCLRAMHRKTLKDLESNAVCITQS